MYLYLYFKMLCVFHLVNSREKRTNSNQSIFVKKHLREPQNSNEFL